jgi:hypothetical protein
LGSALDEKDITRDQIFEFAGRQEIKTKLNAIGA